MNRRSVLAALATGTAALAGCLGDSDGENGDDGSLTPEPTPTAEPTETPTNPSGLTVGSVTVAPQVVALNSPDSIGTYGERGEQYLLVEITTDTALDRQDLALVAGEDRYSSVERVGEGGRLWPYGDLYAATEELSGWLAFAVPKPLDAQAVTLSWPGGEYAITDQAVGALARPPTSFDVTVEAPEQVEADSPATLSVTVENTGDAAGTFVGALNRIGPSIAYTPETAAELTVEAGETDTWEGSYTPDPGTAGSTFTFEFVWQDGDERREIEIVEPEDDDSEDESGSGSESDSEGDEESGSESE